MVAVEVPQHPKRPAAKHARPRKQIRDVKRNHIFQTDERALWTWRWNLDEPTEHAPGNLHHREAGFLPSAHRRSTLEQDRQVQRQVAHVPETDGPGSTASGVGAG